MTNLCEHGNFATQLPLSTGIAFTRGNASAFSIFRFCYHLQLCTAGDPLNSFNPLDWTSPAFDSSSLMSITWNTLHVAWHRYPPSPLCSMVMMMHPLWHMFHLCMFHSDTVTVLSVCVCPQTGQVHSCLFFPMFRFHPCRTKVLIFTTLVCMLGCTPETKLALGSWFGLYTPLTQILTLSAGVSVRRLGRYIRTL